MTFGAVMIVKDEAERIRPCLASLRPHINYWTVLDTGSTDGTPELIAEQLLGIPGTLHRGPFENFGSARSRAFAFARGTAEWLLASDADMSWTITDWQPDPDVDAYLVDMGGVGGFRNRLPLVLRGDRPWISVGPVHEYTVLEDRSLGRRELTDAIRIEQPGATWTDVKGLWHAAMLDAELAAHPGDPRWTFYLAQTLRDLGDGEQARALYRDRVAMGDQGHPQERFVAAYQAAGLQPDWRVRIVELLGAWEIRPTRLEPLYDAVFALNEHEAFASAYVLASVAVHPTTDDLFVHTAVWEWGLARERQRAAAGLGITLEEVA